MEIFPNLGQFSSKVALICDDHKQVTYGELTSIASKISNVITERCLIFVLGNNSRECIAGYLGIFGAYAVPALVDKNIDYYLLTSLIGKFCPKYIYTPISRTDITKHYPTVSIGDEYTLLSCHQYGDYEINDDLAQLITTSGSTGSPKFVRLSYKNITSNLDSITKYLAVDDHDRAITTMPMSYSYGLSIINTHLTQGASLILNNYSIIEEKFWSLIRSYCPTTFGGVPYFYKMLHRFDLREFDIPSLRYLTHAGGPLNLLLTKDLIRLCDNRSIAFYSMYGQAEASPRMSYLPWNNASSKMGSIGVPISGGRFWLEDKAGTIISSNNEVGQLVYQGDNVCLGYAERYSDLNKSDENNGILHTGDTAYFDAEGFYYITGRTSRFLKVYGSRVNLDEVESLLEEAGYEVACSGSDDNIKIYLTLENDTKHIIDFISAKTSLHRTVFSTHVVDFIPRAASGKIIYSELV